jgi:hypothetical protein
MFGIDECRDPAGLLRLGDGMERKGRLARAFRAIDFDDAAARKATDPQRDVEPQRPAGDGLDLERLALAEFHCRALAERTIDLRQRCFERLFPVHAHPFLKSGALRRRVSG